MSPLMKPMGTVLLALAMCGRATAGDGPVGLFEGHGDVGDVLHSGSSAFDAGRNAYTLAGSGENMWAARDAFQFAWKRVSGDTSIAADIAFEGAGTDPHRKACLMIRQGLDADSAYVDVAIHGDGLTSLQFRAEKGERTQEVRAAVKAPHRVRIEKRGKYATLFVSGGDGSRPLAFSGAATRIVLEGPFYVGIGVCSHNKDVVERAVFSNVELVSPLPPPSEQPVLYSTLETMTMASTDRSVVHVVPRRIEAPNWLADGKTLIFNGGGRIHRVPTTGGEPVAIDTGFATRCNNDHGVSPDGKTLVISDQTQGTRDSLIYTLPVEGGTPRQVTPTGPSYWHGWSPDGKTLAFCGRRGGEYDIYTIPAAGGTEARLTTAAGLDDGPEYSPDGRIYFNSVRGGSMQIWRMNGDGSDQQAVTDDGFNNWFPHVSPNGRTMVFLSYEKGVEGHPEDQDVTLRRMDLATGKVDVLARLFGGQGTINVPCWSPDGKAIAFVTYQRVAGAHSP
ncbi:TolB family protein [Aquisphaera insulae]|uniref:TolB family protein n=1 Tax=Aquisphaera insulae TaxID=2712864 RepID=UPI00196B3FA9|nr:PD40 domain-containing protein [Aquisphaera insulae]